jgi:predicted metal-dependent phosphoesterase TrpH
MSWTLIAHCHTRYSADCAVDPAALVRRAVELGADVLAVTDHDTWEGSVACMAVAQGQGGRPVVVPGSEVHTEQGDVIGLFMRTNLRERKAIAFCDGVHDQGGLVLLPHPYRSHRLDEALLKRVDLVEVFNSRTASSDNQRAALLAEQRRLPGLVGPDAHWVHELELARVEFEGEMPREEEALKQALLHAPRRFHTAYGSVWNEWRSQWVLFTRQPDAALGWGLLRGAARRALFPGRYELR